MKKWTGLILCLLLIAICAFAAADGDIHVSVEVTYEYDMAREVIQLVNDFRQEEDVWYWNEDNTTTTVLNNLPDLTRDEDLEKVAMQRAAECAIYYAHTRPNGESCFSIYPASNALAENIAMGQWSAEQVFNAWREENDKYSGQGHRRNMLSQDCTRIGVGCVKANGRYFWCQAFCGEKYSVQVITLGNPFTVDASLSMLCTVNKSDKRRLCDFAPAAESLRVDEGTTVKLPQITAVISNSYFGVPVTLTDPAWTTTGQILTISGNEVSGITGGNTTIVWNASGNEITVPVRVVCTSHTWGDPVTKQAPTCSSTGIDEYTCTVCGEMEEREIPIDPEAHKWSEWAVKTAATCSATGVSGRACSLCSKTEEKEIPIDPDAHNWSEWTVKTAATCSAAGVSGRACALCSRTEEQEIPIDPDEHAWGEIVYEWADDNSAVTATRPCTLNAGHNHTLTVQTDVEETPATYTATGEAVYTAVFESPFTTQERKVELPCLPRTDLGSCSIAKIADQEYSGKAIRPGVVITDDGAVLAEKTDYKLSYKNNKKIGLATVKITGLEKYEGTCTVTFRINPKKVSLTSVKAGSKQLTVKWKKGSGITGYEIQYGLKKNFKGAKTIIITKAKTTSQVIKKLKAKKTYYVRIRAYKTMKGKKYYSAWSAAKKIKVK